MSSQVTSFMMQVSMEPREPEEIRVLSTEVVYQFGGCLLGLKILKKTYITWD